ncbi:hypothetical protein AKJ09_02313 [Labilithrix luteola]|uniref:Uncharacterized protein n=1 Tax=Labilithrix luteola TaxID=1391654 RepID=A0A0K1PRB0_9BACT|nr:hypothetical protein [Labilithrix luteola]AKU95649.1 hypothetical protein AKJ09_02313 [Labilithrix luteola]
MSREPIRFVDLEDAPSPKAAYMRDIIRAQQSVPLPEGKMEELADRLGPLLRSSPSAVQPTRWLGLAMAVIVTGVLASGTLSKTVAVAPTTHEQAGATAPVPTAAERQPTPPSDPPALPVLPTLSVEALPSANIEKAPAPAGAVPRCDDVMLVDAADTELRNGKPESALATAREHERRCPTGTLVQERERIAIEALVQLGRIDQARARARAFEERFPSSPHVGRIQQALERHPH